MINVEQSDVGGSKYLQSGSDDLLGEVGVLFAPSSDAEVESARASEVGVVNADHSEAELTPIAGDVAQISVVEAVLRPVPLGREG